MTVDSLFSFHILFSFFAMPSFQSESPAEGSHVFNDMTSKELDSFRVCRKNYVIVEAARSAIRGLVGDENNSPNTVLQTTKVDKMEEVSKALTAEVFEFQRGVLNCLLIAISCHSVTKTSHHIEIFNAEVQKEKKTLWNKEGGTPRESPKPREVDSDLLRAKIEQAQMDLQWELAQSKTLDASIAQAEKSRNQAGMDLEDAKRQAPLQTDPDTTKATVEKAVVSGSGAVPSLLPAESAKNKIERFQAQRAK